MPKDPAPFFTLKNDTFISAGRSRLYVVVGVVGLVPMWIGEEVPCEDLVAGKEMGGLDVLWEAF